MEIFVFLFFGVIIVFVVIKSFGGWEAIGLSAPGANAQKRDESRADEILDRIFDGSPTVVHTPQDSKLGFDVLIKGAIARGYKLSHSEGPELARTHVFDRAAD